MGNLGLLEGIGPLALENRRKEEERVGNGAIQKETYGLPGLAEAHFVGEDTAVAVNTVVLAIHHPPDAGGLVGMVMERREGSFEWGHCGNGLRRKGKEVRTIGFLWGIRDVNFFRLTATSATVLAGATLASAALAAAADGDDVDGLGVVALFAVALGVACELIISAGFHQRLHKTCF